jgi:predicted AlkP superfamily pyrophosphatase or phosphodiesterase
MTKILLIGLDGLNLRPTFDPVDPAAPFLTQLRAQAAFARMTVEGPTISGPSWATLLTGASHSEHDIVDNLLIGHRLDSCPDLLTQAAASGATTFAAAGWGALVDPSGVGPVIRTRTEDQRAGRHRVVCRDGETYGYRSVDAEIAAFSAYALREAGPDVSFVYFCDVDDAGHVYGAESLEYREAIRRVDALVARLVDVVRQRAENTGEEWIVAVTTDHGHRPEGGHGGDSEAERSSFVIGYGVGRGNPVWPDTIRPVSLTPRLLAERRIPHLDLTNA